MKRRPLTVIILLYIIALVVGRYYSGSLFLYFVFSAMGIAWFIVAFIKKAPALWWFMGFLLLFGFWYGGTRTAEPPPFPIAAEETCTVTGKVITFPEVGEDKQTFLFRADAVNGEKSDLKLYISASVEDDISYCDILEITGTVSANHPVANPGGFAFGDYLRNLHASAVISSRYDGKVETIGHDANVLESCFSFIRNRFETACEPLTRQGAAMVRGIFLGDTSSLDQEYTDVLTKTGIPHFCSCIVALQALNLRFSEPPLWHWCFRHLTVWADNLTPIPRYLWPHLFYFSGTPPIFGWQDFKCLLWRCFLSFCFRSFFANSYQRKARKDFGMPSLSPSRPRWDFYPS